MRRRQTLRLAGGSIVGLVAGCTNSSTQGKTPSESLSLKEIYLYAHPEVRGLEPIDVEIGVEDASNRTSHGGYRIADASNMDGTHIRDNWGSNGPYTVTISTSIHEDAAVFTTDDIDFADIPAERDDIDCILLLVRLTPSTIRPSPLPRSCSK